MRRPASRGARLLAGCSLAMLLALVPTGASAQEEETGPVVATADIEVVMSGGADTVEATYTVEADGEPVGDVEHVIMLRPGAEVTDLAVTGDVEGDPAPEAGEGTARFTLSAGGETATYTLSYQVTRDEGTFAVPLAVPDLPTDSSEQNVTISAVLPDGETITGESFPVLERGDGGAYTNRQANLPSVLIADYGGGGFGLGAWTTVLAVLAFAAVAAGWYVMGSRDGQRRHQEQDQDAKEAVA